MVAIDYQELCNDIHQYPIADCMNREKQLKNLATDLTKQEMECLSHSNILNITTKVEACCDSSFKQVWLQFQLAKHSL